MKHIHESWNDFEFAVHVLVERILQSRIEVSNIYGVPRGGLIIAVRLSHLLEKPLITNSIFADSRTLFVDDVIETGESLKNAHKNWHTATLYWNPTASFKPEFFAYRKIGDIWIDFPWESK